MKTFQSNKSFKHIYVPFITKKVNFSLNLLTRKHFSNTNQSILTFFRYKIFYSTKFNIIKQYLQYIKH